MRADPYLTQRAILVVSLLTFTKSSSAFLSLHCCVLSLVTILMFSSLHLPESMLRTSPSHDPWTFLPLVGIPCWGFLGRS